MQVGQKIGTIKQSNFCELFTEGTLSTSDYYYLTFESNVKVDAGTVLNIGTDTLKQAVDIVPTIPASPIFPLDDMTLLNDRKYTVEIIFKPNFEMGINTTYIYYGNNKQHDLSQSKVKIMKIKGNLIEQKDQTTHFLVHAKPGTLMCMNGQKVVMNDTGTFEIDSNFLLTFLSFVPRTTEESLYMIDYFYE